MRDVGIVGLDTSHPEAFASIVEGRDDTDVTAVWDSGIVRDDEYARDFCERFGATLYQRPEEMIDAVDGAMILTVDWDLHCDLAEPFLRNGVPTLVDKPIVGRFQDIDRLEKVRGSTPIFGGSSVPYHPTIEPLLGHATNQALYCVGYDDPFYYGGHLIDTVRRIVGANWTSVEPSGQPGLSVDIVFEDDTFATVRFDGSDAKDFVFLSVGNDANTATIGSDSEERQTMYESYLDAYLRTIGGSNDESERVVDSAKLLLAVHASLATRQPVTPESSTLPEFHKSDDEFVENYEPYY